MSASKYLGKEFGIPIVYTMEDRNNFRNSKRPGDRVIVPMGMKFTMAKILKMYPHICMTDKGCFQWTELLLAKGRVKHG